MQEEKDDTIVTFTASTTFDGGAFYCPYIPLTTAGGGGYEIYDFDTVITYFASRPDLELSEIQSKLEEYGIVPFEVKRFNGVYIRTLDPIEGDQLLLAKLLLGGEIFTDILKAGKAHIDINKPDPYYSSLTGIMTRYGTR